MSETGEKLNTGRLDSLFDSLQRAIDDRAATYELFADDTCSPLERNGLLENRDPRRGYAARKAERERASSRVESRRQAVVAYIVESGQFSYDGALKFLRSIGRATMFDLEQVMLDKIGIHEETTIQLGNQAVKVCGPSSMGLLLGSEGQVMQCVYYQAINEKGEVLPRFDRVEPDGTFSNPQRFVVRTDREDR